MPSVRWERDMGRRIDVSIIMLVYRHERYLEQALDSVLMQKTALNLEVLVGEDASPDGSGDILRRYEDAYPGFFTVFYRTENMGGTRNAYDLLSRAKGRYIAFLEGDDFWTDERKIQKQADFLERHPEYQGAAGDFCIVDGQGARTQEGCVGEAFKGTAFTWADFLKSGFVFQTGTLMFRNYFLDGGDYTVYFKAHELVGDLTNLTLILNRGDIFILPDPVSAYRVVISPDACNACSVAKQNPAVSTQKTVRQYVMLNAYVRKKGNFNRKIGEKKADFMIQTLKKREGYTWPLFFDVLRNGSWKTEIWLVAALADACRNKMMRRFHCERRRL